MATETAPRERELVAAFLIDIGPPLGALSILRGLEDWTGSETALSALRETRIGVEGQAAELWFGFARFCRGRLNRNPEGFRFTASNAPYKILGRELP